VPARASQAWRHGISSREASGRASVSRTSQASTVKPPKHRVTKAAQRSQP
jgi:hypothetical protein